jgi:hypothetical protein
MRSGKATRIHKKAQNGSKNITRPTFHVLFSLVDDLGNENQHADEKES